MTLPPDNPAEQQARAAIPHAQEPRIEQNAARPDVSDGDRAASENSEQAEVGAIHPLVEDIRSGLVDMEARAEELRRREQQCARQERLLELLSRVDLLDVKPSGDQSGASESSQQRALVEALATLVEQEAAGALQQQHISSRITDTLVRVSQRKREIVTRLQQVRAEIEKHQQDLVRQHTELEQRGREVDRRIQGLERDQKLQEDRARELAQSERKIAQRAEQLTQQAGRLSEQEEQLRCRGVMLDASSLENERRAARIVETAAELDVREQSLSSRGAEFEQQIAALEFRADRQKQRADELDAKATELASREEQLQARAAELDDRSGGLAEHDRAHRLQLTELDKSRRELDERIKQLVQREAALELRESRVQERVEELTSQTRASEQREGALASRAEAVESRSKKLDEVARKLSNKKSELVAYGEKLEQGRRELNQQRESLAKQREQWGGEIEQEVQAQLQRRSELLTRRETELTKRSESIDQLHVQARQAQEQARLKDRELAELQERIAGRESQLSRESLQLEVDRERLREEYVALAAEQEKLAKLQLEAEAASVSGTDMTPIVAIQPAVLESSCFRRRAVIVTVVTSVIAGLLWYLLDQPRYRGVSQLAVATTRGLPRRIIGEHADELMTSELGGFWKGPPELEAWTAARDANRIAVQPLPDRGRIRLTCETADRVLAESLPSAAAQAYAASVEARSLEAFRSPREIEWLERHATLDEELRQSRTRCTEIEARLAELPMAADRESAQQSFDHALDAFEQTVANLRSRRAELRALEAHELPRGLVTPEQYQQTLADDAIYQEDLKEFASEARQYRTELAVAMVLLDDPLRELRKTVQTFGATLSEQNDLQPPPNVRVFLEKSRAEIDDFDGFLAEFSQGWSKRREKIERLAVSDQVVELFNYQTQAMDAAARLIVEARRVRQAIITRIDDLSAGGNSGTREIVVTSLVRGDMSRMTEQIELLAEAVGATNPANNFRIDAHDRQLRGLRTRLRDRQELVRQNLQEEADQSASLERTQRQRELREAISEIEQQRQAQTDTLVNSLQQVRQLDRQYKELSELSAELKAEQAAARRLAERMTQLEARRPPSGRDVVKLIGSEVEQIAGRDRVRNASLVGGAAFATVGLLFLLTFATRPRGGEEA